LRVSEWQRRVMLSDRAEPAPAASDPKAVQALRAAIIHLGIANLAQRGDNRGSHLLQHLLAGLYKMVEAR
jgi:hypothetical protein